MPNLAPAAAVKKPVLPLEYFLSWCDKLGLAPQAARHPTLVAAIRAQAHDAVLFLLCGRDYIYHPTDLKIQGIETIFFGPGAPCELNVGSPVVDGIRSLLHAPVINVRTEIGMPHTIGSYVDRGGIMPKGVANYNLGTNVLTDACYGLGSNFLRDMVKAVNKAKLGEVSSAVTDAGIFMALRTMRNAARRFWIYDMPEIGL